MEYTEVRRLIEEVLHRKLRELIDYKKCPKCRCNTSMIKLWVEDVESKDEFAEEIVKWRCLNCLGLFSEELKEVE